MNVKIDYKLCIISDVRVFDGCEAWSGGKVKDFTILVFINRNINEWYKIHHFRAQGRVAISFFFF